MNVSAEYAEDDVAEIFAAAYAGEKIEIELPDRTSVVLFLKKPQTEAEAFS